MAMLVWILLGAGAGFAASKLVTTTGEGTVVDILLGVVGAIIGGSLFNFVNGADAGFLYGAISATAGAAILLIAYHLFLRRRML